MNVHSVHEFTVVSPAVLRPLKYTIGSFGIVIATIAGLGGANLYTYQRFTAESPVAVVHFTRSGPGAYDVTLVPQEGDAQRFSLTGDEWQLDVRMIKWKNWLAFLGESPLYRLDRISGRYADIEQARRRSVTAFHLGRADGIDVWSFARKTGAWLPGIDAVYGSSVFLPMKDDVSYEVSMSATGLLARLAPVGEER